MKDAVDALPPAALARAYDVLGADSLGRAVISAGASAVGQLMEGSLDVDDLQSVLTAFEPSGFGLGVLLKTFPARDLCALVDAVGVPKMQCYLRVLEIDGLKHLFDCVGLNGCIVVFKADPSDDELANLREDLGRRSVRLTLQLAKGADVARLLRRGLSARQLQRMVIGADRRAPGLGARVIGRLASLSGSDTQLHAQVATLSQAMQWTAPDSAAV